MLLKCGINFKPSAAIWLIGFRRL